MTPEEERCVLMAAQTVNGFTAGVAITMAVIIGLVVGVVVVNWIGWAG